MEHTQSFRFFNRGPSPVVRLVFFAALSLLLLFVDARFKYLESTRTVLSIVLYPLQKLASVPGSLWQSADTFFTLQGNLIRENAELRHQHEVDAVKLQELQALQAENQSLRQLLAVQQRTGYVTQMAEIVYVERDIFKRKLFLDKGSQAGVQAGQVVMDDTGIVGQITRVYPWLSEVTLITDKDHAVPVQVLRTGLRSIIFGSGDTSELALRYMPVSADLQNDDVLVTSGIDGTYPPGLPVAKVNSIERDPAYPFARVQCMPLAGVSKQRHLLILSSQAKLPERPAPVVEAAAESPKKGKRKKP
ncbi:MAG: rod shape-determining protein MreC [Gallionellaceae bacterium]|nr:rod shape-determining protein MreC [Gallionellaceae bacterium]